MSQIVCLNCGGPAVWTDGVEEMWFWRYVTHGRLGPFDTEFCARSFRLPEDEPRFSLREIDQLLFMRYLYRHMPAGVLS